jgi:GT2 family glycosyltransferase
MRLIAAVPNYNAAHNLPSLLAQLLKQGFDEILLLDDASTDDSVQLVESNFAGKVTILTGTTNLGPAGNRNRVLSHLRSNDYILFIDADMELLSTGFRKHVLRIFEQETTVAVIGGLIFDAHHEPMRFNYGYFSSAFRDSIGSVIEEVAVLVPPLRQLLRPLARLCTVNLDIRYGTPERKTVDWVSEALCFVRGDVFQEVGGFDERLQYHEGQDLALRIHQAGFTSLFWPEVHARHLEYHVRSHYRTAWLNWFKLRKVKH